MTTGPETAPATERRAKTFNPTLIAALVSLAAWVFLAFLRPVPAGWVHVFLGAGVILLVRRVVTGPRAW